MHSFLHSTAWERFQNKVGNQVERFNNQVYIRKVIPRSFYYVSSRCEIGSTFSLPEFSQKGSFLRFEPTTETDLQNLQLAAKHLGHRLVPTSAIQPRQTLLLDIRESYEKIIQDMKPKHRYNIRLAEKNELETEIISTDLKNQFERFWQLLSATASRQEFRTHSKQYYESMLEELEKEGMAHLLFVSKDKKPLAAMILITYEGTATYLHGGSDPALRQLMGPYLLHATAIQFAQKLGCHSYDFWGTHLIHNPETDRFEPIKDHPSEGTSRFKIGFGGQVVNYPGTFDLILQPFWYTLYITTRKIRLRGGKRAFS